MKSLIVAGVVGVAALATVRQDSPSPEELTRAGELYREQCLACHQPPDLRFPADRAFLNQVADTA